MIHDMARGAGLARRPRQPGGRPAPRARPRCGSTACGELVELHGRPAARATRSSTSPGTNGKGSTARMITALLVAQGLSVGTYTSPDLERVNERLAWNGEPIADGAFVEVHGRGGRARAVPREPPHAFEILTAAAFRWFADIAVDAAVVEVGLGGRWDATNVADGQVAVVTNVSLDHAGGHRARPAPTSPREKAGIVKPGSVLVLGETDPDLAEIFAATDAAEVWQRDATSTARRTGWPTVAGSLELRTPGAPTTTSAYLSTAPTRATTPPSRSPRSRRSSARPSAPDVVAEAFAAVRAAGPAGGASGASPCRCSTAPTTRPGRRPWPGPSTRRSAGWQDGAGRRSPRGSRPGEMLEALDARRGPPGRGLPAPVASSPAGRAGGGRRRAVSAWRRGRDRIGRGGSGARAPRGGRTRRNGAHHRLALRRRRGTSGPPRRANRALSFYWLRRTPRPAPCGGDPDPAANRTRPDPACH